jgi:hypothetical protein
MLQILPFRRVKPFETAAWPAINESDFPDTNRALYYFYFIFELDFMHFLNPGGLEPPIPYEMLSTWITSFWYNSESQFTIILYKKQKA